MIRSKSLIICFFFCIWRCIQCRQLVELKLDQPSPKQRVSIGTTTYFCINTDFNLLSSLYKQVNIYAIISNAKDEFDWHTVRGKSSDDFHSNVQSALTKILDPKHEYNLDSTLNDELNLDSSFLRDLVSACPSPIFHQHNKQVCSISFTPTGRSCISVTATTEELPVSAVAKYETNYTRLVFLLFGMLFLLSATYFSENKLFQYVFGVSFFISTATLLIFIFILHRTGSRLTKSVAIVVAMFTGYGAGLIWFLQHNIRWLILSYWEFAVFYAVLMLLIALVVIQQLTYRERMQHIFRVSIKWMVRLTGAILLYNASSSPLVSLGIFFFLIICYVLYTITKPFRKKPKPKKDSRYRD